jgi:hypothetical protein
MAFKNEYIPPVEQETSEFCRSARELLRTGYGKFDRWTVDRERKMVLFRRGGGHSMEAHGEDYWSFVTSSGEVCADTELLSSRTAGEGLVEMTRAISFRGDPSKSPDADTLACIKEALSEYGRWNMFNPEGFERCDLKLIDARTKQVI